MPANKKRSDQRLGHTGKAYHENIDRPANTTLETLGPEAPEWLDGFALDWYESLRTSGQAVFFTDSDWTSAVIIARGIMEFIRRPSATMLSSILEGFGHTGATEGARRRMNIELGKAMGVEDPDEQAGVTEAEKWYGHLGVAESA